MNTIVIWDEMEVGIRFFVTDGDRSVLNGTYINGDDDPELVDDLNQLVYGSREEPGEYAVEMLEEFPHEQYVPGKTAVIVCGFLM